MMSITNSVGLWNWTVRDHLSVIVEKSIQNMYYYSDGHDNGAGERRLEIGDMTVFNKIPGEKYDLQHACKQYITTCALQIPSCAGTLPVS